MSNKRRLDAESGYGDSVVVGQSPNCLAPALRVRSRKERTGKMNNERDRIIAEALRRGYVIYQTPAKTFRVGGSLSKTQDNWMNTANVMLWQLEK